MADEKKVVAIKRAKKVKISVADAVKLVTDEPGIDQVVVIGVRSSDGEMTIFSNELRYSEMVWLIESAKLQLMIVED